MEIEKIKNRINKLIRLADQVIASKITRDLGSHVNPELFHEFRSSSLSFFRNIFGEDHPFYKEFDEKVNRAGPYQTEEGRGILKAAKQEIDEGWIFTIKGIVSAEIFSDFLEMASYLLDEHYKDAAAVMIGSTLEEHLRQLSDKNSIPVEIIKQGRSKTKKAEMLNSELASTKIYNKLDQKSVTSWLDLRNKAAHGKYSEYKEEQVKLMYQGVLNFISRTT